MIAVVVNEVLLADILTVRAETGQTKDDNLLIHAWIETSDVPDDIDSQIKLFIARGKIIWSSEQGGLILACRDVSKFVMPSAEEVEPNAAA